MEWLGPALAASLTPLVLGWLLARTRKRARRDHAERVLEYGAVMKGFALGCATISLGFLAMIAAIPDEWIALLCLAALFGLLAVPLLLETLVVRIVCDDRVIRCRSPWRRNRTIPWEDVTAIVFSPANRWWVVSTESHGKLYLQSLMGGADELRREIEARLGVPDTLATARASRS